MSNCLPSICVFTDRGSIGFRSVLKGIMYAARERGWAVRTVEQAHSKADVRDILRVWQPIGSLSYGLSPIAFPEHCPCVHINPKEMSDDTWTVCHDSRKTGELAAHELMKLAGRDYAFVGDPSNAPWSRLRGECFARTLAKFGFKCTVCNVQRQKNNPLKEQQSIRRWIETFGRPTAIFAANDKTAESVLAAALDAGLEVPNELAILGVDDDANLCENAPVTLSSITPDFFRGGAMGCALLERRICNPNSSSRETVYYADLGVTSRASTRLQLKQNALVSQMREFIRLHATEGISASDIIRETGRQRRTIELIFKSATGKTIGEELQGFRIELAQRALADESVQIGEVPALVGYGSHNQLERLFKRTCGMTMRDYRRRFAQAFQAEMPNITSAEKYWRRDEASAYATKSRDRSPPPRATAWKTSTVASSKTIPSARN